VLTAMIPGITRHRWIGRLERLPVAGRFAGSLLEALALYQSKPQVVLLAILLSIVGHVGMLTAFYCCSLSLNAADSVPGYFAHLLFIPAAELAAMVPLVPGGGGALEGAIAYFYQVAGAEFSDGFLTGLAYRGITIVIAAIAGGYYLTMRREVTAALHDSGGRLPDLA
jgi:glycosyltransferase 2 family protein